VCALSYNKLRKRIICVECGYNTCSICIEKYFLMNMNDYNCMKCKNQWKYEFILKNFTKSSTKRILSHRKKLLYEREKSKFPDTQLYVKYQKEVDKDIELRDSKIKTFNMIQAMIINNKKIINDAYKDIRFNKDGKRDILNNIRILNEQNDRFRKDGKDIMEEANRNFSKIHKWTLNLTMDNDDDEEIETIVYKCQVDICKGFVMSNWKCGLCSSLHCRNCYNLEGEGHICNIDDVRNISTILNMSKICPCCGIMIHKIDGCSQIWCTNCQTTFDYHTGIVECNSMIHNPHYYEWFRNNNDTDREGNDITDSNRIVDNQMLMRHILVAFGEDSEESSQLFRYTRLIMHVRHMLERLYIPDTKDIRYNMRERIDFMMNKISEKDFKSKIQRKDKLIHYNVSLSEIYETFIIVMNDISYKLLRINYIEHTYNIILEFKNYLQYVNEEINVLSSLYGCKPQLLG